MSSMATLTSNPHNINDIKQQLPPTTSTLPTASGSHHVGNQYIDHPSEQIWSIYLSGAERYDKALTDGWKSDMDGILIFVSASRVDQPQL
jgi:hypothetical protein